MITVWLQSCENFSQYFNLNERLRRSRQSFAYFFRIHVIYNQIKSIF